MKFSSPLRVIRAHKYITAIILIIIVILVILFRPKPLEELSTEKVGYKDLIKTVSANGKINSSQEATLTIPQGSKIVYIGAQKGDLVKKGQVLVALDQRTLQKNLESSLRDYAKQRNTFESTLDTNNASRPQDAASESIKRVLENNQYDLEKAVLSVELVSLAKEQSVVVAPIAGVITNSTVDVTGVSSSATDSISIADPEGLQFLVDIDEADIGLIQDGQSVEITLDAFPNKTIAGTVNQIDFASHATSTGGTAYSTTVLLPIQSDAYRIGMNGDAEIVVEKKKQILTAPSSSLFEDEYVYVKKDKIFEKRKVTVGIQNDFDIEISSGLSLGEEVALDPEKVTLRQKGTKIQKM